MRKKIGEIAETIVYFISGLAWSIIYAVLIITFPIWIFPWILIPSGDEDQIDEYNDEEV